MINLMHFGQVMLKIWSLARKCFTHGLKTLRAGQARVLKSWCSNLDGASWDIHTALSKIARSDPNYLFFSDTLICIFKLHCTFQSVPKLFKWFNIQGISGHFKITCFLSSWLEIYRSEHFLLYIPPFYRLNCFRWRWI